MKHNTRRFVTSFFTIILLATGVQPSHSQPVKVTGRAVSALTKAPIPFCQITYSDKGTISDSSGYFVLDGLTKGIYTIHFHSLELGNRTDTLLVIEHDDLTGKDWPVSSICDGLNRSLALSDIAHGNMKLFLQSGDPPVTLRGQKRFSKRYKVEFYDFADLVHHPYDCLVMYNRVIFEHLDKTFGSRWRKGFNHGIPGYF